MRNDALPDPLTPGKPWGLAATLGLGLVIWYALELLQAAMGTSMERVLIMLHLAQPAQSTQALSFAVISCISAVLCGALVIAAARLRDGLQARSYLGLTPVPGKEVVRWLIVTAVIVIQTDLVLYLAKGELLPAEWVEIYRTAIARAVLAALLWRHRFSRSCCCGFVFAGIQSSRLGGVRAVMITALAWAVAHGQNDPLESR
jgi:hypothetical protein